MSVSKIRGFLLQHPKPVLVRVTGDGEPQTLKPGRSYAKLAETIIALDVDLVEALDKEGNVSRAIRIESVDVQRSAAAEVPEALKGDPAAAMLTHFSNLVHRAYEHSTEIAFAKMVELVEKMNERSEGIEKRLERSEATNRSLLQEQVDDAFERAEEVARRASENGDSGDLLQQMGAAFLSGRQHATPSKTNGKASNGKGD